MALPKESVTVVGHPLTGKDEAGIHISKSYGFTFVSTGDFIREYTTRNGLGDLTPQNLNKVSTEARRRFGPSFPIPQILLQNTAQKLVICGPRVVAEVSVLKACGSKIIAIGAPQKERYERALKRKRIGDEVTFEQFVAFEELESSNSDPSAHNVSKVITMADAHISNNGTLAEFHAVIGLAMRQLFPK